MSLSITTLRTAKPAAKPYKLADEKGLFLLVQPSGGMLWRFKYRTDGRDEAGNPKRVEKKLGLGIYPDVGLKDARELRDDARALLAKGLDPADQKRRAKQAAKIGAANTFAAVAESYIAKNERDGLAENTVIKRRWLLKTLRKALGHRPLTEIEPFAILDAVRPFEAAKNEEKAQRALNFVGQVYRFAVANQLATSDPTRDLRGALTNPKPKHHAAILEPKKVGELLRAIEGYEGNAVTLFGLRLSALLFVRSGELRKAEWTEIDFDAAVWRIRAERMKGRVEHVVPLSRQAVALLREVQGLTGDGRFVFPSIRTPARPMSENTVNGALRRRGLTPALPPATAMPGSMRRGPRARCWQRLGSRRSRGWCRTKNARVASLRVKTGPAAHDPIADVGKTEPIVRNSPAPFPVDLAASLAHRLQTAIYSIRFLPEPSGAHDGTRGQGPGSIDPASAGGQIRVWSSGSTRIR